MRSRTSWTLAGTALTWLLSAVIQMVQAANVPTAVGVLAAMVAPSSTNSAASVSASLSKLEDNLFEFTYPGDDEDARLNRLEKFVFGAKQTGTDAVRLSRLQSAITSNQEVPAAATPSAKAQTAASTQGATNSSQSTTNDPNDAVVSSPAFECGNYPRVTELEKDMLGKTYVSEPLPQRLSRLETKAFGTPSKSDDLCARVDNLDQYAERNNIFKDRRDPLASGPLAGPPPSISGGRGGYAPSLSMTNSGSEGESEPAPSAPVNPFVAGVTGTDQRLSAMEEFVYGHNYVNRPLQDRLARLEKRLVPYEHNLAQKDVATRVNNLWSILSVANTLKNAPTAAHPANMIASSTVPQEGPQSGNASGVASSASSPAPVSQTNTTHHSWLHKLGQVLDSPEGAQFSDNNPGFTQGSAVAPGLFPPGMAPRNGTFWFP